MDIDAIFSRTIFIASVVPVAIGFILDKLFPLPYHVPMSLSRIAGKDRRHRQHHAFPTKVKESFKH